MERDAVFRRVSHTKELVGEAKAIMAFGKRLMPAMLEEDIPGVTRRCQGWL